MRVGRMCSVTGGGLVIALLLLAACGEGRAVGPPPVALYATAAAAGNDRPMTPAFPEASPPVPPDSKTPIAPAIAPPATASLPGNVTQAPAPQVDQAVLAAQMLDLINRDRAEAGLGPVVWDDTAARAGVAHAADMIARSFFSHWNPDGFGPDHRYSAAGGVHVARENLYTFSLTFEDGRGVPIDDWSAVIEHAEAELMNSPGHRANILDPAHSHVGIGMAYNAATGQFRLAQEFTNHHVELDIPLPSEARPGEALHVVGVFGPAVQGGGILDLAYEPFPAPLSPAELSARSAYTSAAQSVGDGRAIGPVFDETITLPATPGLYHLRLFVDLASGQAQVLDHVISVR